MKKRKKEISKLGKIVFIPIINIFLVLIVSNAFAKPFLGTENSNYKKEEKQKNEKTVSVYFHNSDTVETVKLENYLMGVVAAEMPPSFNEEALKAQAVAARTFIINRENVQNDDHKGAAVCTDFNHCKAYISDEEAEERWGEDWNNIYRQKIENAVLKTCGEIVTYEGEPISAVFHSTSSGKTENSEDVWQNPLPYLRSVVSEGEEKSPRYTSTESFTKNDFKERILKLNSSADFSSSPDKWIGKVTYNESGSIKTIEIGGVSFKGTEIRECFSLRSSNFTVATGDNIVFNVKGNGHGVGMSQYGANYAAENGYTYDKILKKYYSGTEVKKAY